ncbi:hypothetical protein GEV41_03465 [Pseudomonas putida]|nr:hypothetical protein GEV41_03465 [Pseudomonas putida]
MALLNRCVVAILVFWLELWEATLAWRVCALPGVAPFPVGAGLPANTGEAGAISALEQVQFFCPQRQNPYLHAQIGVLRNES